MSFHLQPLDVRVSVRVGTSTGQQVTSNRFRSCRLHRKHFSLVFVQERNIADQNDHWKHKLLPYSLCLTSASALYQNATQ